MPRLILRPRWLVCCAMLLVLGLYSQIGGYPLLRAYQQQQRQLQQLRNDPSALARLTQAMRERVLASPQDAKAWYLLGKLYLQQQDYQLAAEAFASGYASDPTAKALLDWQQYAVSLQQAST